MDARQNRNQLALYLLLVFGISSLSYFLMIRAGHIAAAGGIYVVSLMWSPALAAIIACKSFGQSLARLGWKWGEPRYQRMAYLIPLLYAAIAYLCVWIFQGGKFYDHEFVARLTQSFHFEALPPSAMIVIYFLFSATAGMVSSCAHALGEEIGWRGFLVPQLSMRYSYTTTSLISGLIWSLWHYPILIFADYKSGTPLWYELTCFTVMLVALSFVFAWFRLKSGSVWTCMFLHASHNLFIQKFFDPMTADTGRTKFFIGEFGLALPLISVAFAFYFWTRRHELPSFKNSLLAP